VTRVPAPTSAAPDFDFGGEETEVALEIGGAAVRRFVGGDSESSFTVVWDLAPFAGEEAVLEIVDRDERLGRGIGIDDILFFEDADPTMIERRRVLKSR
jgi:hypothetical protein